MRSPDQAQRCHRESAHGCIERDAQVRKLCRFRQHTGHTDAQRGERVDIVGDQNDGLIRFRLRKNIRDRDQSRIGIRFDKIDAEFLQHGRDAIRQ